MIVTKDLEVAGAYTGVSMKAETGTLTAVTGESGSGRTSLLLTLAGRMKPTAGELTVAGRSRPREIRKVAAMALVDGVTDLDRQLTVRDHLRERRRKPYKKALHRVGFQTDERTRAGELSREEQVRLGVALALLDRPQVIVADNLDQGLTADRQSALWDLLRDLTTNEGLTVVASSVQAPAAADQVVRL